MKTYFTKYLPVEGEIKEGDKFFSDDLQKVVTVKDVFIALNTEHEKNVPSFHPIEIKNCFIEQKRGKKVKLFLCSRDIQVGDTYTDAVGRIWENAEECFVKAAMEANKSGNPDYQCYKVIGKVSYEATWVTEGMEFDKEEIKIMKRPDRYNSKIISEMIGEVWDHEEDSITIKGEVDHVKIKCPNCQNFH